MTRQHPPRRQKAGAKQGRRGKAAPWPADLSPEANREIGRGWLLAIFLVALAYRGLCFLDAGGQPLLRYPVVDAGYHDKWAARIAAGDWLGHGPDDVAKPPLYPMWLGAMYAAFGRHVALIQWTQLLLGAISCVFVAILSGRLLGRAAGRVAGLLSAGYAPCVFFELQLLTPALSIFLNLAAILLLVPVGKKPGYGALLAAGVLWGLSAGVRPDVLVPALLVLVYLLLRNRGMPRRELAARALCVLAGMAAVLLPILARNYRVTRQLIPVSSNSGINFYIGNSAAADGISAVPVGLRWERMVARVPQQVLEKPATANGWWMRAAWREIKAAPGPVILRLGRKALAFFNRREFRNNICYHFMQRISSALRWSPLQLATILPLAVCGLVSLWRRGSGPQRTALALSTLWVAGYWVMGVAFFITARYRLPAIPLLIPLAAWGLLQIVLAVRSRQWRTLLGHAAVAGLAGVVCWPAWLGSPQAGWVRDYVNLSNSLVAAKDTRGARAACREALTYETRDPDAHYLLGRMLLPARPAEALEHFQAARQTLPDSPELLLTTGQAYLVIGDPKRARQTLLRIPRLAETSNLWPTRTVWATAHILLAGLEPEAATAHWQEAWRIHPSTAAEAAFLRHEDLPRVLETFRAQAVEKPWDWYCQANYAMALLQTDQPAEAVTVFRRAVALAPDREALRFHLARALLRSGSEGEATALLDQLLEELPACLLRQQAERVRNRARKGSR